jgi:hypothetical protein
LIRKASAIDGWERIQFHYFSEPQLHRMRAQWQSLSIIEGDPGVAMVPRGLIAKPPQKSTVGSPMVIGVYDADGQPVTASIRFRGDPAQQKPEPSSHLHDSVRDRRAAYYLGVGANHYGHFLLETLCRAWAWEEQGEGRIPVLQFPPIPSFARSMFALIPGLAERIEVPKTATRYSSMMVPFPGFALGHLACFAFKELCARMADRALSTQEPMTDQPMYLSRAGLDSAAHRFLVGETRLEECLAREGFLVVRPETLSIAQQIALFNKHRWIVAPMGSACHTRLFSRIPTNLVMLTRNEVNVNYVLCDMLNSGTTHYANVLVAPDLGLTVRARFPEPLVVDDKPLLEILSKLGLVRPGATLDGVTPDICTYRRKWIEVAERELAQPYKQANPDLIRAIEQVRAATLE